MGQLIQIDKHNLNAIQYKFSKLLQKVNDFENEPHTAHEIIDFYFKILGQYVSTMINNSSKSEKEIKQWLGLSTTEMNDIKTGKKILSTSVYIKLSQFLNDPLLTKINKKS